ncbi:hypothetical protein ACLMJK_002447 [Lecanora helva]
MVQYLSALRARKFGDAVRLDDVRKELIDTASAGGKHYSKFTVKTLKVKQAEPLEEYEKHGNSRGEDPLNVTSFLAKDEFYGYERENRPDVLFTLYKPKDQRSEEPSGYLMFEGRVCLDPYLHGIRYFPELPATISSEVDGQDIEYWIRQNARITRYDIMARMPTSSIVKGRHCSSPPGLNSLTQRMSRFRAKAGCLSWDKNAGTENKNNYILSLLPGECKDPEVNSTKAVTSDLDDHQRKVGLVAVNKGQYSQKRRKSKRVEEAEQNDSGNKNEAVPTEVNGSDRKRKRLLPKPSEAHNVNSHSPSEPEEPCPKRAKTTTDVNASGTRSFDDPSEPNRPRRKSQRVEKMKSIEYKEVEQDEFAPSGDIEEDKVSEHHPRGDPLLIGKHGSSSSNHALPAGILLKYTHERDGYTKAVDSTPKGSKTDMRSKAPTNATEQAHLRRALQLTCIHFCQHRGHAVPNDLIMQHHEESYESQYRQIQQEFDRSWRGAKRPPKLYRLPAWYGNIADWKVPRNDGEGQNLMGELLKAEKAEENWDPDLD